MPPARSRFLALLRGINVGGRNLIPKDDQRRCFEDLGYTNVKVYAAGYPAWQAAYGAGETGSAKMAATKVKAGTEEGSIDTATFVKMVNENPESMMLGKRFAVVRNVVSFVLCVVIAIVMVFTLGMIG